MITKLRVIEAMLAGDELDEDDRREFNEDLPELLRQPPGVLHAIKKEG
jgi:hypothetical protein